MKHIGIVDITTVGACICANEIVSESARHDASGKHPEFTMHSFSYNSYKVHIINNDWFNVAKLILESISKLQNAGADFIIIPSNTPHYAIDLIQKNSPLPVINLIELVADDCKQRGFTQVAVVGTKHTMQGGLYDKPLKDRDIAYIVPDNHLCEKIHDLIMLEIIPSKIKASSVEYIKVEMQKLKCDAIILGCTELPEVYNENNLGIPVIDTTRLIAHAALKFASHI